MTSSVYKQYKSHPSDGSDMWFVGLVHDHVIIEAVDSVEAVLNAQPLLPANTKLTVQEWKGAFTRPTGGYYEGT